MYNSYKYNQNKYNTDLLPSNSNATISVSTLNIVSSINASTIIGNVNVNATTLNINSSTKSVTVNSGALISPNALNITSAIQLPTVIGNCSVLLSVLSLTSTANAPNVTIGGNATISASTLNLISTTNAPTLTGISALVWTFDTVDIDGWYRFDEGTGTSTTADSSGNGNTGTLNNFTNASWVKGELGYALNFVSASSQYVTVNDAPNLNFGKGSFSIAGWVNTTGTSSMRFVNKFNNTVGWIFDINAGMGGTNTPGNIRFRITDGTINQDTTFAAGITVGNWYHLAIVIDRVNNIIQCYVNGSQVGTNLVLFGLNTISTVSNTLGIGGLPSNLSNFFNGIIDDVRIYNRTLSATEISGLASIIDLNNVTTTILAPTVSGSANILVSTLNISSSTQVVTVSGNVVIVPSALNIFSAVLVPIINVGGSVTVNVGVLNLVSSIQSPVISGNCSVWSYDTTTSWWTLNDGSGTVALDSSGNGHNGTLTASATTLPLWVNGKIGNALSFDGTNYVNLGASNQFVFPINQATLTAWINTTSTNSPMKILSISAGSGVGVGLAMGQTFAGRLDGTYRTSGNSFGSVETTLTYNDGNWHHIAWVINGINGTLYVDSINVGTTSSIGSADTLGTVSAEADIATSSGHTQFFIGTIDDVRLYNRALTQAEVSGLSGITDLLGLSVATVTPTISGSAVINAPTLNTGLTIQSPTVQAGGSVTVNANTLNITSATLAPLVSGNALVVITTTLNITSIAQNVTESEGCTVSVGTLNITNTANSVTVTGTAVISPFVLSITSATYTPSISGSANISAVILNIVSVILAPTIKRDFAVSVGVLNILSQSRTTQAGQNTNVLVGTLSITLATHSSVVVVGYIKYPVKIEDYLICDYVDGSMLIEPYISDTIIIEDYVDGEIRIRG